MIEILEIPGIFPNPDIAKKAILAWKPHEAKILDAKANAVLLAMAVYPDQAIFSKKPLRKLEDFKGVKTRVHSVALSMMVTTVPILVPVLKSMGIDLVWCGIIMVILLEAALVSPPEGLNLYVIHGIRKSVQEEAGLPAGTMIDLWLGVLPFMIGMAVVIALIIEFPQIALWLPDLVKGK